MNPKNESVCVIGGGVMGEAIVGRIIADVVYLFAILAILLSLIIAFPVGVIAASRRGSAMDTVLNAIMQVGVAMPNFWVGLLLILAFSSGLGWFAAGGFVGWDAGVMPAIRDLLLPALALALPQAAITARVLRTSLLETMNED